MGLAMAQQLLKSGNTLVCIARSTNADLAIEAKAAGVTIEQWQQDLSQGEQAAHKLQAWLQAQGSQAAYCAAKAGMDHFTRCVALDEALKPHGAKVCSLAPGVIDTDMQVQLRGADPAAFPDRQNFANLKTGGQLTSPTDAAIRVLAWLERADFGTNPVADVRDA